MVPKELPPVVVCVDSNRLDLENLYEHLIRDLQGFEIQRINTSEAAYKLFEKLAREDRTLAMLFVAQDLTDSPGDRLLVRVYERWPHSMRMLMVSPNGTYDADLIEQAKAYRIFYKPLEEVEFKTSIREAARYFKQRQELSFKSQILTELHRATMSLTGEMHLKKLMHKLMRIVIDNADAQNGYLIMHRGNEEQLFIEASGHAGSYDTTFEDLEVNDFSPVCPAIVEYSRKTRENVILHDAINEGMFTGHPYIRKNLSRSILCTPLVYQGKLFGLLYLDNNQKTNAFSPYSMELFQLLSAPAAIAIQNATLYGVLEAKVSERTAEVLRQKAEIEHQRDEIKEKNEDILGSIRYARRIQDALLPKVSEIKDVLPNTFIYYKPKDIVSGDFFWYTRRLSKSIVAAADCTGHGIPGAFMTVMANTLLKQIVELEGIFRPDEILNQLHLRVRVALKQEGEGATSSDGLDIALCQIDTRRRRITYAGANRPLLLIRNKEILEFKGDKFGVGGTVDGDSRQFTQQIIDLEPGDTIYMFTDGYQDQIGEEINKRFKSRRFYQLLADFNNREMDHQRLLLDAELRHWRGDLVQTDDILIIGIRFDQATLDREAQQDREPEEM